MTIRFVPRDRCNTLSNKTNKTNDTKTSLIVVKPTTTTTLNRREKETNILNSLSRENENSKSHQTRTSKTVNRSFSLAFFRHKFNTFIPNASASDASFAFDMIFYHVGLFFFCAQQHREAIYYSRFSRMFKISNSLSEK